MEKIVTNVALREIVDDDGAIDAEGIIAEDVVSKDLAVILPAGTSLSMLEQKRPKVVSQLSKLGVTHLKVKNLDK